jgi:hypothetical protein
MILWEFWINDSNETLKAHTNIESPKPFTSKIGFLARNQAPDPQELGRVYNDDAPFLPRMTVIQEQKEVYQVETTLMNTQLMVKIPKHLLPRNRSGAFLGKKEHSADIMT